MKLVIIAGGKGTRLGCTTIPKPMVPIGGMAVLEHQLRLAYRYGIREVFILSGFLANTIFDHFGDGSALGMKITHVVEPAPLGTAGSVALLRHVIDDRFMVFYGDVMLDMDLARLIACDREKNALATLVVHPNDHPYDSDLLEVDENGFARQWHAKPHAENACYGNTVNAGVYILSPEVFSYISYGKSSDFGRDVIPSMIQDGRRVFAYRTPEFLKDMGTPDRLAAIDHAFVSGRISRMNLAHSRSAVFLDRDGTVVRFVDHLVRPEDLELADGAAAAIRAINRSEHLAVLVTNQPMLAKGMLSFEELAQIHTRLETLLGREHAWLDAIYFCPHHPRSGFAGEVGELKVDCECRKPKPGMLLQAAADLNIALEHSWMVGDQESDLIAGRRAGCRTIHIGANSSTPWGDASAMDLPDAVRTILEQPHTVTKKAVA
ncbi:MAG: HAD-IIIA family hydrolase [Planctomycetia bacterium]|nr:HAD-IIIA family hydrolase [Planctomycetia bacterium]